MKPVYEIQGKITDSIEEVWIAKALTELSLPFRYHVGVLGFPYKHGSYEIDFVVNYTTALEYFGNYWHEGVKKESSDQIKLGKLRQMFNRVEVIYGRELNQDEHTYEDAKRLISGKFF
jgi:hypothetical protein